MSLKNKKAKQVAQLKAQIASAPIRLDFGAGQNKKEGFLGVDIIPFAGVDVVMNIGKDKWKWKDNTVDEAHASHFLEHLTNLNDKWERVHFFNELYRVLKVGARATLIFPHWCSNRYYGDPTHKEPFSEMGFYYLSKEWRATQAPHTDSKNTPNGYSCDFECTWGYNMRQDVIAKNQEYQQFAMANYKEVITDITATLVKK